jgi:hypothetical protein
MQRLLLLIAPAYFLVANAHAAPDAGWQLPDDGDTYAATVPSSENAVPFDIEISSSIPSGYYLEIYSGTNRVGSLLRGPASNGMRRFSGWLAFYSAGSHSLTAKASDGFSETTIEGPTIQVVSPAPPPTFFPSQEQQTTGVSISLKCGVDSHGVKLAWNDIAYEYGLTTAYGTRVESRGGVIGGKREVEKIKYYDLGASGLQPSTTYHFRLIVKGVPGPDQTATTTPNHTPIPRDDIGTLDAGGVAEVFVLQNDEDESAPARSPDVSLTITSQPTHGTAEVSISGEPRIRYTAGPSFEDFDEFTYTIRDSYGAEAKARVVIGSRAAYYQAIRARYVATVFDEQRQPIGTLSVNTTRGGRLTGSLTYYDAVYPFSGDIGPSLRIGRIGLPPMELFLYFSVDSYEASRIPRMGADLFDPVSGGSFTMDTVALIGADEEIQEAGDFVAALRNPEIGTIAGSEKTLPSDEIDRNGAPQGHGFVRMKISRRGSTSVLGRMGDNRPFSSGSRLRRDNAILVNSRTAISKPSFLSGVLGFDTEGLTGPVSWQGRERGTGAYQAGFNSVLNPDVKRRDISAAVFSFPEGSPKLVKVSIGNHRGGLLTEETLELKDGRILENSNGSEYRIRIKIDPKTRVFSGTVKKSRKPIIRISGIIPMDSNKGLGVAGKPGLDAPVELTALGDASTAH